MMKLIPRSHEFSVSLVSHFYHVIVCKLKTNTGNSLKNKSMEKSLNISI